MKKATKRIAAKSRPTSARTAQRADYKVLPVRLTAAQDRRIARAALKHKMKKSAFMRECALDAAKS